MDGFFQWTHLPACELPENSLNLLHCSSCSEWGMWAMQKHTGNSTSSSKPQPWEYKLCVQNTQSFLMRCVKTISATSFSSTPHNNLTIWTELLVHSSWGMRLLHTMTLPGKAPAQPWDCCTSPHRQNCSRQMEKPMLEQQMTVGAKTHFSWKDQEANDETNPTKMCRGHHPWRFRARFVMQIENSSFQEGNEWKQRDYLTQEKRQLQGSFCYQTGTVEIAMAPGWFSAELLVTPTIFQPPFPQHCGQPSVWWLKGWTVMNHLSNGI